MNATEHHQSGTVADGRRLTKTAVTRGDHDVRWKWTASGTELRTGDDNKVDLLDQFDWQ